MTTARDVVGAYLRAFGSGDLEGVAASLVPDVRVDGPIGSFRTRDEYLAALRADPPRPATVEIVERIDAGERVAVIYDYLKPGATLRIAQFFWLRDTRIARTRLVFDRGELGR